MHSLIITFPKTRTFFFLFQQLKSVLQPFFFFSFLSHSAQLPILSFRLCLTHWEIECGFCAFPPHLEKHRLVGHSRAEDCPFASHLNFSARTFDQAFPTRCSWARGILKTSSWKDSDCAIASEKSAPAALFAEFGGSFVRLYCIHFVSTTEHRQYRHMLRVLSI